MDILIVACTIINALPGVKILGQASGRAYRWFIRRFRREDEFIDYEAHQLILPLGNSCAKETQFSD